MSRAPSIRPRTIAAVILTIGWAIALIVYVSAAPAVDDPDVYDIEHSKAYVRQTEVIGGKAAVLGNDLREWFASLWHGQRLAYTIAVLTALVALGAYWWFATEPPPARDG